MGKGNGAFIVIVNTSLYLKVEFIRSFRISVRLKSEICLLRSEANFHMSKKESEWPHSNSATMLVHIIS